MTARQTLRSLVIAVLAAGAGAAAAVALDAPSLMRMTTPGDGGVAASASAPAIDFAVEQRSATAVERALARRAEALVDVKPAQIGFKLAIRGPVPGLGGQTDLPHRTITLFIDPSHTPHLIAHDLGHEIGHAVDDSRMTNPMRNAWLSARHARGRPWFPPASASDYSSGAGDFAEVFALCHAASPEFRSTLAPAPARPCALLPAVARTQTLTASRRHG